MIMHVMQPRVSITVPDGPTINAIDALMDKGVRVYARTLVSPAGDPVTIFWVTDDHGGVTLTWEHTYTTEMGQYVTREADRISA